MKRPLPQPNTGIRDRQIAARRRRFARPVLELYPPATPLGKLLFAAGVGAVTRNLAQRS